MYIRTFSRCCVALFFGAVVTGCSSDGSKAAAAGPVVSERDSECKWNRSKCMHEGSYEVGERDYAEQEAKRLNHAAFQKLRRSAKK